MTKIEKVLNGLSRCCSLETALCDECPYNNHGGPNPCEDSLLRDARDVLQAYVNANKSLAEMIRKKEQKEPRVMTFDEIKGYDDWVWLDRKTPSWIGVDEGWVTIPYYDKDNDAVWFSDNTFGIRTTCNKSCHKGWRCWTSRPTDEQRQHTPWGDDDV